MSVQDTLKQVAETAGQVTKEAIKKSEELINVAKLRIEISQCRGKIKTIYSDIGKAFFYENFNNIDNVSDQYAEYIKSIIELQAEIEGLKNAIGDIQEKKVCKVCGSSIDEDSLFCSKCGNKTASSEQDEDKSHDTEEDK